MEHEKSHYLSGRFILGFLLIVTGAVILLNNFDLIYLDHIGRYWPAILIAFGIVKLSESESSLHRGKGIWWIFLGAWLLISLNGMFGLNFGNSWPLLLIGMGVSSIWKGYYRQPQWTSTMEHDHGN